MNSRTILSEKVNPTLIENVIDKETQKYYLVGPFAEGDIENRNGRIYPTIVLKEAIDKFRSEWIDTNRALGELEHPDTSSINPERAAMKIIEMTQKENIFYGRAIVLDAPTLGGIVKALMNENVKLGVSTRGLGTIKGKVVQDDFELITVDIVTDPSAPSAFVDGIVESKKDWLIQNHYITERKLEQYDSIKEKNSVKKAINLIFNDFFDNIKL